MAQQAPSQAPQQNSHPANTQHRVISAAANLILADAQKKIMDPDYKVKSRFTGLLPRNPHSPFGDFPGDSRPKNVETLMKVTITPGVLGLSTQQKETLTAAQKKAEGAHLRDKTSSFKVVKSVGKPQPQIPPPKAGALQKRTIAPSEFRRYAVGISMDAF